MRILLQILRLIRLQVCTTETRCVNIDFVTTEHKWRFNARYTVFVLTKSRKYTAGRVIAHSKWFVIVHIINVNQSE